MRNEDGDSADALVRLTHDGDEQVQEDDLCACISVVGGEVAVGKRAMMVGTA